MRAAIATVVAMFSIVACSASVPVLEEAGSQTPLPTSIAEVSTAVPVDAASPLPPDRPLDFAASYSETAGMAPWGEHVDIESATADYEVWMNDVTYVFSYTPTPRQLDFLYDEIRLGRFEEYEVIPFAEGDEVFDAGTSGYRVETGSYEHRLLHSDQRIDTPSTDHSPLAALRGFVDMENSFEATSRLTISIDPAVVDVAQGSLYVNFDLGEATFAMGDERWAEQFEVGWSGETRDVPVTITWLTGASGEEPTVESEQVVSFTPGGTVSIVFDAEGTIIAE